VAPETPIERVDAMRKAFATMVADREFLADADRMKLEIIEPMDGARLTDTVEKLLSTPVEIVERTKAAITPRR
jgi:tripartite-type tricarboxylate transporter receptor subunit TctC